MVFGHDFSLQWIIDEENSGKKVDHEEMIFILRPYFVVAFTGFPPTKSLLKHRGNRFGVKWGEIAA